MTDVLTRHLGLLVDRDYRALWIGTTISHFGTQITALALPLVAIVVLHAGPAEMGALNAVESLPFLLIGLPAGVWVDRYRRRPILIVADVGRGLLLLSVTAGALLGVLSLAQLYVVGFFVGILSVFFETAYTSYLPSLVPADRIVEGNTKLEASRAVASIAGPSVSGFLVGIVGAANAIALDGASFLASAAFVARIRRQEPAIERHESEAHGMRVEIASGLRWVFTHPILRASLTANTIANVGLSIFQTLFILYLVSGLGLSAPVVGLLLAVGNVVSLAGAVTAGRIGRSLGVGRTLALGLSGEAASYALVAIAPPEQPFPFLVAAELLLGFMSVVYYITSLSLRQTVTPARIQGRMNATYRFASWGVLPLGAVAAGLLGSAIGVRPTLGVAAALGLAGALTVLLTDLRKLRTPPPASA